VILVSQDMILECNTSNISFKLPYMTSSQHLETGKPAFGILSDLQKVTVSRSPCCNRIPLPPGSLKMFILSSLFSTEKGMGESPIAQFCFLS